MKPSQYLLIIFTVIFLTGCASVVVRDNHRSEEGSDRQTRVLLNGEASLTPAGKYLKQSLVDDSTEELADLIHAARLSLPDVASDPVSRQIYAAAVARIVGEMRESDFSTRTVEGVKGVRRISVKSPPGLNPAVPDDLVPVSAVRVGRMPLLATGSGIGVPYAAVFDHDNPFLAGQPGVPLTGMVLPVTAVVTFSGQEAHLQFAKTLDSTKLKIDGRNEDLAYDFSTPLAIALSRGRNSSLDLVGMLRTDKRINEVGLYQIHPYDPDKIPLVLVHGLMSRPETWRNLVNNLLADPEIQQHYQFWFYLYPTGLPVWASSAKLRDEMDRFHQTLDPRGKNPVLKQKIVVGHSMGGLIANLLTRKGGLILWKKFSDVDPAELNVSAEVREMIEKLIFFEPRKDVSRMVFASTPHRGSPFALRPISNFGASLIRLPFSRFSKERPEILRALRDDTRSLFVAPANSIRFLKPESPLLTSILELPKRRGVVYHSIIGDRGRGDTPDSTDGIVPYWSSHLPEAISEKIVPSGHGSNDNPEGIAEIHRILLEAR